MLYGHNTYKKQKKPTTPQLMLGSMQMMNLSPSSLLRTKPRLSSYFFTTLLAFILFAIILYGHDFIIFIFPQHLQLQPNPHTLFSTHTESTQPPSQGDFIFGLRSFFFSLSLLWCYMFAMVLYMSEKYMKTNLLMLFSLMHDRKNTNKFKFKSTYKYK